MKKFTVFTSLSFLLISSILAQETAFTVILNKGNNTHGNAQLKPVILGETLMDNERIVIADEGYMALVHDKSGISLEINKSGQYPVKDLIKKAHEQSNSVLSKYGKFLISKLNPEGTGNQNLNVTGAVERGDADHIKVFLPMVTDVYGNDLLIAWQQTDDIQDYVLTVKNSRDQIITQKQITGTKYKLSFDQQPYADMKLMIINIRARSNGSFISKDYGINRISEDQKQNIRNEYEHLVDMADGDNVISKLLIASFFEENELLGDAISYYDQALALSPDTDGFDKLYNNFLYRNKLK
jgi:hypothetical protein